MKVKKSKVPFDKEYFISEYPESGIYLNVSENNRDYLYVDKKNLTVLFLSTEENAPDFLKETVDVEDASKQGVIGENFALKMLSIATKNDKYNEL